MNSRQLQKLGVPGDCVKSAITAIQNATRTGGLKGKQIKLAIQRVLDNPRDFIADETFGAFAKDVIEDRQFERPEPISYRTWGTDIDHASHAQMQQACRVPMAVGGALMPDAHVGYGLPIGGVLGLQNAVIPYAVGVDIACRMKLSVVDLPLSTLEDDFLRYKQAIEEGTRFGVGSAYKKRQNHPVMDQDWTISRITREKKDLAWSQLGTSGSGNHFVDIGILNVPQRDEALGLDAGRYVAIMSHSGSRGPGAAVCQTYSNIARAKLPAKYADLAYLAWLSLDSEAGQEYWAAMNLMGNYAAANHEVIHRRVTQLLGAQVLTGVENHHNFAWKEMHGDQELIVHRKGATPAGQGVLGVIPGSMASPAFVIRGRGNPDSLHSASHGAGRRMSRRQAKDTFRWKAVQRDLHAKGIRVLSAGADEVPGVYKDIEQVISQQADLVEIVARFDPKIVKMCGDGSKAED
jgi:tRNA-splicing ligase RtcB (3'-phosphate/5'-hydroxy nucleic acid ligase)